MKSLFLSALVLGLAAQSLVASEKGPTRQLSLETREVYTFKQGKNQLIQTSRVVEGEIVIVEVGKKNKVLYTEDVSLIDESSNVIIKLEPRNTVRFIDKELNLNKTVKARSDVGIFGQVHSLTIPSRNMNYINQSSLISQVNKVLNKTKLLYGFFDHHIERSDFSCVSNKSKELTCTHYVAYYVGADGATRFGKF